MAFLLIMGYKFDDNENMHEEKPATYEIPSNFVAESTVMWGMFKTRRAIEAGVVLGTFMFIIFNLISSTKLGLIFLIVLGVPIAFLALLGLNDGPLSEYIIDIFHHIQRRKVIEYDRKIFCDKTEKIIENSNNKEGDSV